MDRFERHRVYIRAWATGDIMPETDDAYIVAASIGARCFWADGPPCTVAELDAELRRVGVLPEEVSDDEPDVGPTERDERERTEAEARLRRLILADGQTDTGGRWLAEAAADEIVRLRKEVDDIERRNLHLECAVGGELRQAKEALEQARAKVEEIRTREADVVALARATAAEARKLGAAEMRERAARVVDEEGAAYTSGLRVVVDRIRALPLSGAPEAPTGPTLDGAEQAGLSAEDADTLRGAGWQTINGLWQAPDGGIFNPRHGYGLRLLRDEAERRRVSKAPAAAHGAPGKATGEATAAGSGSVAEEQGAAQGLPKPERVEAGQRWRWSQRPFDLSVHSVDRGDVRLSGTGGFEVIIYSSAGAMLTSPDWTFLGASPQDPSPKRSGLPVAFTRSNTPAPFEPGDTSAPTARDAVAGMLLRHGLAATARDVAEGRLQQAAETLRGHLAGPGVDACIAALEALARGEIRVFASRWTEGADILEAFIAHDRATRERLGARDEECTDDAAERVAREREQERDDHLSAARALMEVSLILEIEAGQRPVDVARARMRALLDARASVKRLALGQAELTRQLDEARAEAAALREQIAKVAPVAPVAACASCGCGNPADAPDWCDCGHRPTPATAEMRPAEDIAREMVTNNGWLQDDSGGVALYSDLGVSGARSLVERLVKRIRTETLRASGRERVRAWLDDLPPEMAKVYEELKDADPKGRPPSVDAAALRYRVAELETIAASSICDACGAFPEAEEPGGMRIEKRGELEWLVGTPRRPNDCDASINESGWDMFCCHHVNGEHVATHPPDADGVAQVIARWPIEAPARDAESSRIAIPGTDDLHLFGILPGARIDLIAPKALDPHDVMRTVAELLGMPAEDPNGPLIPCGPDGHDTRTPQQIVDAAAELESTMPALASRTRAYARGIREGERRSLQARLVAERAAAQAELDSGKRVLATHEKYQETARALATRWRDAADEANDKAHAANAKDDGIGVARFSATGRALDACIGDLRAAFCIEPTDPGKPPTGEPAPDVEPAREPRDASAPSPEKASPVAPDRETLGRAVHEVWASRGSGTAKWDDRTEHSKELLRLAGERLFSMGVRWATGEEDRPPPTCDGCGKPESTGPHFVCAVTKRAPAAAPAPPAPSGDGIDAWIGQPARALAAKWNKHAGILTNGTPEPDAQDGSAVDHADGEGPPCRSTIDGGDSFTAAVAHGARAEPPVYDHAARVAKATAAIESIVRELGTKQLATLKGEPVISLDITMSVDPGADSSEVAAQLGREIHEAIARVTAPDAEPEQPVKPPHNAEEAALCSYKAWLSAADAKANEPGAWAWPSWMEVLQAEKRRLDAHAQASAPHNAAQGSLQQAIDGWNLVATEGKRLGFDLGAVPSETAAHVLERTPSGELRPLGTFTGADAEQRARDFIAGLPPQDAPSPPPATPSTAPAAVTPLPAEAQEHEPGCGADSGPRGRSLVCTAHFRGKHMATGVGGRVYSRWPIEPASPETPDPR